MEPTAAVAGRARERATLRRFLDGEGPGLALVTGPRGSGKSALLTAALEGRDAVYFQALPLPPEDLLRDLEAAIRAPLGHVPEPRHPGLLPLTTPEARWQAILTGLADRAEGLDGGEAGGGFVLALDDAEALLGAHRRMGLRLLEALDRARERGTPVKIVVAARTSDLLEELRGEREAGTGPWPEVSLGPLPYRVAGWAHGASSPRDAFLRWALLGDHPAHLARAAAGSGGEEGAVAAGTAEEAVLRRVLDPAGDLFDGPVGLVEATFQRPARYVALLRVLAEGPLEWGEVLERTAGVGTGGQLAPYLRRLEEEGLVRVEKPLGSDEGARNRRYRLADPFLALWFGLVLPHRSLLPSYGAETVWRERIRPRIPEHLGRWLPVAARRWLRDHADELLPAPARSVGALWGEEADFDVVGWLENGQVCYGLARWSGDDAPGGDLASDMVRRMKETRHGLGREARAPLYFLPGPPGEEIRRHVAREPLAKVVGLEALMGAGPPTPG